MCLIVGPLLLLAPFLFAALLVIASAPVAIPYLLLTRPDQFGEFWVGWVLALPASPFVAYRLAAYRPAPTRRLRARRRGQRARPAPPIATSAPRTTWTTRTTRTTRRRLVQTAIVLPVTGVVGLVAIRTQIGDRHAVGLVGSIVLLTAVPITTLLLGAVFSAWEHRHPPAPGPGLPSSPEPHRG